jgi:tRNA(Ile2) C34 agmatinyltransferase TiaS
MLCPRCGGLMKVQGKTRTVKCIEYDYEVPYD